MIFFPPSSSLVFRSRGLTGFFIVGVSAALAGLVFCQENRGGRGGGFGFGPGGPPGSREQELVPRFDRNGNGVLDTEERAEARAWVKENGSERRRPGGRRGPFGGGPGNVEASPGPRVEVEDAQAFPDAGLYDPAVLRTLFLTFSTEDWEAEMSDFYRTDVAVPAKLTVDGEALGSEIGVSFRGNSSFFTVSPGRKRSMNLDVDAFDDKQRLHGYRTLNLINAHADPSFIREALFSHIAGKYLPTPKVNFVKLVINGESWGVYVHVQQFNKDFLNDHFDTRDGVRWKVPASPGGGAGLVYHGEEIENYRGTYQLKTTRDEDDAYKRLIRLCRVLAETPPEQLEESLEPIMDIDNALWFLAIDNVLQDGDGYLSRGSDFSLYEDPNGRFHFILHDNNESFRAAGGGGPGFNRGGGGFRWRGGFGPPPDPGPRAEEGVDEPDASLEENGDDEDGARPRRGDREERRRGRGGPDFDRDERGAPFGQDPLLGVDDERTPLVKNLLAVPALKARYLAYVRLLATDELDWEKLEPVAKGFRALIAEEIAQDTKKLSGTEAFEKSLTESVGVGRRSSPSIKEFVEKRREFLLNHEAVRAPYPRIASLALSGEPAPDDAVMVTATFARDSEADAETFLLHYSPDPDEGFQSVLMESFQEAYAARVPGFPAGTQVFYYAEARSAGDASAGFFPPAGAVQAASYRVPIEVVPGAMVVINEIMAANEGSVEDPHGDHDDWIELYNASEEVVDLSGYRLSDNEEKLDKWVFPVGTTIAPRGYLVVWADEDGKQDKGLHANFKLAKGGEKLVLSDAEGKVLDLLNFERFEADKTLGRPTDGAEGWVELEPTPAAANAEKAS